MHNVVSETAATPVHARREVANYGVVCLSVRLSLADIPSNS